jgi:hypothetical protein
LQITHRLRSPLIKNVSKFFRLPPNIAYDIGSGLSASSSGGGLTWGTFKLENPDF